MHAIGNGVRALIDQNIDPLPYLTDPGAARLLVDELLRFDAPLHMFTRYAVEDLRIGDLEIACGDQVGLLLGAANHDPAIFHEPGTLAPDRDDGGHASFGAGIHFCVGAPLARAEVEIAIRVLFERASKIELQDSPAFADRYHFHGHDRLMANMTLFAK